MYKYNLIDFIQFWPSGTRSASHALDPGSNPTGARIIFSNVPSILAYMIIAYLKTCNVPPRIMTIPLIYTTLGKINARQQNAQKVNL